MFGSAAENALNSLGGGNRVVAAGDLTVKTFHRSDGSTGVGQEIIADHLGAALTFTTIITTAAGRGTDAVTSPE